MNNDAKLEKLQKKHELEKQAAVQELSNFKAKMNEREQKISSEFQAKFDGVRKEIENMNSKFQEKIAQFEGANQELRRALDAASTSGSNGLAELRKRHEQEIAELVKTSNEKYQNMLLQQLAAQEDIKKEGEFKLTKERQALLDKYKNDLEQEIGQIRAKLSGDKQEALLALRRELEDKLNQQKTDFISKMEKLINDLKFKSEECEKIRETKDGTIADLEKKIAALNQSMNDQVGGKEARVTALSKEVGELSERIQLLQAKLQQREEEIQSMQKLMNDKSEKIMKLESSLGKAEAEVERLKKELLNAGTTGAANEQELRNKLATSERESASLRAEINQMGTTIASLREDLKKAEKFAQKAAAEAEKTISTLNSDKENLMNKIAEMQRSSNSLSDQAQMEIAAIKKTLSEREEELAREKMALLEAHQKAMLSMKESHATELAALTAAKQAAIDLLSGKEAQLRQDLADQKKLFEERIAALEAENAAQLTAMTEKHAEELETFKNSMMSLEGQLQTLTEQADAERAQLKKDVDKLDAKVKTLQKELDARKKESERAEGVTNGLKNQVESLREELKASQKAFRDKMDMSTAKLEAEWQERLDAQIALGQKQLREQAEELTRGFMKDLDELRARHEDEVRALKGLLQKEAGDAANELANAEKLRQKVEAELAAEKAARAAQVSEMTAKHTADIKFQEEARRLESERLRRELNNSSDARELALVNAHNAEVARLNALIESNTQEYAQNMATALESNKLAAEELLRNALKELETRLTLEKNTALSDQSKANTKERAELVAKYDAEKSVLNQHLQETQRQLKDTIDQVYAMQKVVEDERAERQRREETFVLERDQMQREHESALRKEKELSERKIIEIMERASGDIKILKQEHVEVRNKYEERIREMNNEYKALMERYQNRESRPEDIQRIAQLEREMVEKDELVLKTKEEMLYFKREMLNREENYNQKFGRSPNVGVMNPLKTKEEPPANGRAKPTQMRMIPQGGPGAMMMGGMGGMGVGDMGTGGMSIGGGIGSGSSKKK